MDYEQKWILPLPRANLCYVLAAVAQTPIAYITVLICRLLSMQTDLGTLTYVASAAYQLLILALPAILYIIHYGRTAQSMRFNPPRIKMLLLTVLLALCGTLLANNLGTWWLLGIDALGGTLLSSSVDIPTNVPELIRGMVLIALLPGICEELFFRGMMWNAWEHQGTKRALLVSSVLFALLHGDVMGFPVQLLMGLVLGYVMLLSNSIYVSMTFHFLYNGFTLFLAYASAQEGMIANTEIYGNLNAYVSQNIGYLSLFNSTLLTIAMFVGVLLWMRKIGKAQWIPAFVKKYPDRVEWLTLLAGLVAVGWLCAQDIARIW